MRIWEDLQYPNREFFPSETNLYILHAIFLIMEFTKSFVMELAILAVVLVVAAKAFGVLEVA